MRSNTFEGGANGTNIVPADSGGASGDAFDFVVINGTSTPGGGSGITYSTAAAVVGTLGFRITPAASLSYLRWDVAEAGTRFVMRRTFVPRATSATTEIMAMRNTAASVMAGVRIATDLKPMFTVGTVEKTASKPATALTAGTKYYAELAVTIETGAGGNGVVEYRILDTSGTVVHTYQMTGQVTGTAIAGQYRFGGITTASGWAQDDGDATAGTPLASGWLGIPTTSAPVAVATVADSRAIIDATSSSVTGGTLTFSISQLSGPSLTPTLMSTGVWSVAKHTTTARVYRVTVTASGGGSATQDVTVPPIPSGSTSPTIRRYRRVAGTFV